METCQKTSKIFTTLGSVLTILPYIGTFRNWKWLLQRFSKETNLFWNKYIDQFQELNRKIFLKNEKELKSFFKRRKNGGITYKDGLIHDVEINIYKHTIFKDFLTELAKYKIPDCHGITFKTKNSVYITPIDLIHEVYKKGIPDFLKILRIYNIQFAEGLKYPRVLHNVQTLSLMFTNIKYKTLITLVKYGVNLKLLKLNGDILFEKNNLKINHSKFIDLSKHKLENIKIAYWRYEDDTDSKNSPLFTNSQQLLNFLKHMFDFGLTTLNKLIFKNYRISKKFNKKFTELFDQYKIDVTITTYKKLEESDSD